MAKMKINDVIKEATKHEKEPTLYKLGTFMNKKSGKYLLSDCSGLIKGILWGYPEKGKHQANGVPDINADTMISRCSKVSTNFNKLPVGALVWLSGHIGIHVGNGVCVESSPIWENGIQRTFIVGSGYKNTLKLKERKWKKHGILDKYIDYSNPTPAPKPTPSNNDIEVDGIWGPATTKLAQKVFGTPVDGIVSNQPKTYASKNTGLLNSTFKWESPCTGNSPLIKAIQKWCGADQDGRIGPNTIKKMQKKLGTPVDGHFDKGGQGIKAFQRWLNKQ